jgi:ornithine cyclodeaminase/alanine dehydrogenase-like protein (mu-crystallin family)
MMENTFDETYDVIIIGYGSAGAVAAIEAAKAGEPMAIFPDGELQPTRVAGTSAPTSKYLAKKDVRSGALIGTGWQAQVQLRAIDAVHTISDFQVYPTQKENRGRFAMEWSEKISAQIRPCEIAREAISGADIALCATNSMEHVTEES